MCTVTEEKECGRAILKNTENTDKLVEQFQNMDKRQDKVDIQIAEIKTLLKIILGVLGTVGGGVALAVIELFFGGK